LIGLETEYGLRRGPNDPVSEGDGWFDLIQSWFAERMPIASALHDKQRFFIANGGCIGLEASPSGDEKSGIVEAATPECRSPFELVAYQAAQDQMLAECLFDMDSTKSQAWIKNSGDAYSHVYGQHENYELQIARSWRLLAWRLGLVCLLPQLIVYRFFAWIWLVMLAFVDRLARWRPRRDPFERLLKKKPRDWQAQSPQSLSPRMVRLGAKGLRYLHWPIAIQLHWLIRAFILVPHRRWMTGFFASRAVVDGSGHLDRHGSFWLSARAASTNCVIGFGRYWNERPIFGTGHWLRSILVCQSPTFTAWRRLFSRNQRVQVTLGDSTPNPRSQHLRIGATALVFDLIEAGYHSGLPRFSSIVRGMKALSKDQSMLRSVRDRQRKTWNAIELQRHYATSVRRFLTLLPNASHEASEIVEQWQLTLDHLEEAEHDIECKRWLLGRVDWFSKRWLMDNAARTSSWAVQKKIDIKYHELSNHGYYHLLVQTLAIVPFVSPEQINRSMRLPPMGTPATQRGYWIREFADDQASLKVDWNSVEWTDEHSKLRKVELQ